MSIPVIVAYIASMLVAAVLLNLGGWWATVNTLSRLSKRLKLAPFVAVRHLKGRKSGFLTAIGVLSIFGVAFSNCTLTTVLSVMGGFSGDLKSKILETNAHIVVDNPDGDLESWRPLLKKVRSVDGVLGATPIVQGEMMMNARSNNHAILLKGIDAKSFGEVSNVLTKLESGDVANLGHPERLFEEISNRRKKLYGEDEDDSAGEKVESDSKKEAKVDNKDTGNEKVKEDDALIPLPTMPRDRVLPALIVGRELSRSLRLYEGAEVNIISPLGDIGPTGPIPKSRPFRVGGVFFSGMYEFDSLYVYTSLEAAQKFMRKGDRVSEIHLAVADPDRVDRTALAVQKALGEGVRVRSWAELNASLFSALKLEKIVMFIFLSLAIMVASFCIIATLTMLVLEKGAEVSTLMTLGATPSDIRSVFRFEGLLIGIVGTFSGLLLGLGLCITLSTLGLKIDPEVWYLEKLPVDMSYAEFLIVGAASLVITQLATLFPADAAARLTPVEGLKYE
jgi:lipoprotein-releasing system permease protein